MECSEGCSKDCSEDCSEGCGEDCSCSVVYWSVVWCSGGCSWKFYKTLTFCSLWTRCTIPCACHAKRALNIQKWSERGVFCTF